MNIVKVIITMLLLSLILGCTHTVEVKEPDNYRTERRSSEAFNELDKQKY